VFENRVLRRIFGPKRDEVERVWRMHTKEHRDLYSLPIIIIIIKSRKMRLAGHVTPNGGEEKCVQIIGGKARRKETTRKIKT
jgi:hypothetical protein